MLYDSHHSGNIAIEGLAEPLKKTTLFLKEELKNSVPEVMIILGSGLGAILGNISVIKSIEYKNIPGAPVSTVSGHKGCLDIIKINNKVVAVMRGRFHTYENYSPDDVVRIIRALAILGTKKTIITNACGSTSKKHKPGTLAIIKDHINLTGLSPLISSEARSIGETFVDLSEPYSKELIKHIEKVAKKLNITLYEGVYAWMRGPQYETASEVKMLNKLGADFVGMSTVPEVIALRQLGIEVAGLSVVTNYGTGVLKGKKLSHQEVKDTGHKVTKTLDKLLQGVLKS